MAYSFISLSYLMVIQVAWDEYKQKIIDEKLERLGVERGFGSTVNNVSSNVAHIHAPHARAASVCHHLKCLWTEVDLFPGIDIFSCRPCTFVFQIEQAAAVANQHGYKLSYFFTSTLEFHAFTPPARIATTDARSTWSQHVSCQPRLTSSTGVQHSSGL